jgi:aspartyl-tRNA(Asn)/glutamyl-tRNA(Gln) amidotransferase subunit B
MINLIVDGTISGKIAKDVFEEMLKTKEAPKTIVEKKGLTQVSDESAIEKVIDAILAKNVAQVEEYKGGKTQVFGFFVGQTMKEMKGKANPKVVNDLLKKKLSQ